MSSESWRRRTLPSLRTAPAIANQNEPAKDVDAVDSKRPRVISKALRSLSSSSMESMTLSHSPPAARRLQKSHSSSGSMIERLHRRVSKDSPISQSPPELSVSPGPSVEVPYASMDIIKHGPLKADISLLKARSEYLVLTDQSLLKFSSIETARALFPQLNQPETHGKISSTKPGLIESRMEASLRSIVAVFNEEGSSPRFGLEVWWYSHWPRLAYSKTHLFFAHPKERDDWLVQVQQACKVAVRRSPVASLIPDNLRSRIKHIIDNTETATSNGISQNLTFPVAKRTIALPQKANSAEDTQNLVDSSSFYVVIGPCVCYFLEVLKADFMTSPGDLRVKVQSFGTVTLNRFKASVASQEQRFVLSFRLPFGRETRLELASTYYRRIIEAMTKTDRELKPMWPQHLQRSIFDVKGLPPPLQLTSGNDLGGLERSLKAYCTAFRVQVPQWSIEWNTPSQPAFRLLPCEGSQYLPLQLLAVFRALRYNSFFKALSFRDVDLSSLVGKKDYSHYGDAVMFTSLTGLNITEEHYDLLLQASVLTQEFHALLFTSESIRSLDLTNILGTQSGNSCQNRTKVDPEQSRRVCSEVLRSLLLLTKYKLCFCNGLVLNDNILAPGDIEELSNYMVLGNVYFKTLELANCGLGDRALSKLWMGIAGQGASLQILKTSGNHGTVRFDVIQHALAQLRQMTKLTIAGNTRLDPGMSLFDDDAINSWLLEELDVSGIALNDETIEILSYYLQLPNSRKLKLIRLNSCGLTGSQVAQIFRDMGQARNITVHLNANRVDEEIEDLCGALSCGFGPWGLFMQMIEFTQEANYVKLLRALTVNKSVECLSLAGSSTPDSASDTACQALSEFFSKNDTIRFLDISGYDAKLDEGRLGRGFSTALSGLRTNTQLEHLRVRSQMLNLNIGDLAEAISANRTLHTLDCEGNDFNLSNFRHLVRHLEENTTIRYFSAFSDKDLTRTIQKSVNNAISATVPRRRSSVISRFRPEKPQQDVSRPLVQQLKDGWDDAVQTLQRIMDRNQMIFQEGEDSRRDSSPPSYIRNADGEVVFTNAFGGLALRAWQSQRGRSRASSSILPQPSSAVSLTRMNSRLQGLAIESGARDMRSYSLVSIDSALSPATDSPSTGSAIPTPPEPESPVDREYSLGNRQNSNASNDGQPQYEYSCPDSQDGDAGADSGLEMRPHRRFWSHRAGRIEEEDNGVLLEDPSK